jgi:hypothetical protein
MLTAYYEFFFCAFGRVSPLFLINHTCLRSTQDAVTSAMQVLCPKAAANANLIDCGVQDGQAPREDDEVACKVRWDRHRCRDGDRSCRTLISDTQVGHCQLAPHLRNCNKVVVTWSYLLTRPDAVLLERVSVLDGLRAILR